VNDHPRISLIGAPSNLGLRPPQETSVPGTAKAPEALREAGLHRRLLARGGIDAGTVIAPRYVDDRQEGRLRNHDAIIAYSRKLGERIDAALTRSEVPLLVGGDCSILIAAGLALAGRGRYGLVHIDGHTDFRHPGNSSQCASLAGEDLAAAIGVHWPEVADIDGLGPYFDPAATVHLGCRDGDEAIAEVEERIAMVGRASEIRTSGPAAMSARTLEVVTAADLDGFWLHIDVDVLDPSHMPAVDSPDPGGLTPSELQALVAGLAPHAVGGEVTVFDPDLDPDGRYAALLAPLLAEGLGALGSTRVSARRSLR
jgi:arginase